MVCLFFHGEFFNSRCSCIWQVDFTDPATIFIEFLIQLHHNIMVLLVLIFIAILFFFYKMVIFFNISNSIKVKALYYFLQSYKAFNFFIKKSKYNQSFSNKQKLAFLIKKDNIIHNAVLEFIWTLIPIIILLIVIIPAYSLLYLLEDLDNSYLNIQVIGNQWYWNYDFETHLIPTVSTHVNMDSYLDKNLQQSNLNNFRLLEVDNHIIIPVNSQIRLFVTSADVIHSFAIPSFGIKIDACPGRINQIYFMSKRVGFFYGQCSELCGIKHAFMPICFEVI